MRWIIAILMMFSFSTASAMEVCIKVGDKYPIGHANHEKGWKDGQIIEIRQDGFPWGALTRKHHSIVKVDGNFWQIRNPVCYTDCTKTHSDPSSGLNDCMMDCGWKSTSEATMNMKKYLSAADSNGKYAWEKDFLEEEEVIRKRDYYIDLQKLKDDGDITEKELEDANDSGKGTTITLADSLADTVSKEGVDIRAIK